jgi:hypothetical protein
MSLKRDVNTMIDAMPLHDKVGTLVNALVQRTPDPLGSVVSVLGLLAVMTKCLPLTGQHRIACDLRDLADELEAAVVVKHDCGSD